MDNVQVESLVKKVISDILGISVREIESNKSLKGDFGVDSLDEVELLLALEDEFDIEIPDEVAKSIVTVQNAVDEIYYLIRK